MKVWRQACRRGWLVGITAVGLMLGASSTARAESRSGGSFEPKVGGHLGMAIPFMTATNNDFFGIGEDFVTLGMALGVNVQVAPAWSFDFEFVTYSRVDEEGVPVSLVVDPGVVYNWGPIATGLRVAMQLGGGTAANFGLIPIINKTFDVGRFVHPYIELDLPIFFADDDVSAAVAFTVQVQGGFAF